MAKASAKHAAPKVPPGLSGVIGHGHVTALLRRAVARDSVPQTLLFAGPDGVGKRVVAVALAQALNCTTRQTQGGDDACGECSICVRIARGQFADVTLLDRGEEASIKIKAVREQVLDAVGFRPFEGRKRIFIINDAEDLGENAQDALLKTLEEPPPAAILILVTAFPDLLRPTILSRCRRLRFGALVESDVERVLIERHAIDPKRARALAAASGGSVSRAVDEADGPLELDRDAAFDVIAAAEGRLGARLAAAAALAAHKSKRRDREALGARLAAMASMLRDLAVLSSDAEAPLANADLDASLRGLLSKFPPPRIDAAFAALTEARDALDKNASPKIVADWVALSL